MSFSELGIGSPMLDALVAAGYTEPTAVQKAAIPAAPAPITTVSSSSMRRLCFPRNVRESC